MAVTAGLLMRSILQPCIRKCFSFKSPQRDIGLLQPRGGNLGKSCSELPRTGNIESGQESTSGRGRFPNHCEGWKVQPLLR